MLRVALIDDERLARQGLRQMLDTLGSVSVVGEADSAEAAAEVIRREKPDAIFLDIHMPLMNGFEMLKTLDKPPRVVFVTAHSQHALQAFEVSAVDYLLKPVRPERLADAVKRLEEACGITPQDSVVPYQPKDRICLRLPHRTIVASIADIAALQAEGDFTRVIGTSEPNLLIYRPLGHYADLLPSPPFVRVDRSLLINSDRIARTERVSRDTMKLWMRDLPEPFLLGRAAQARLKATVFVAG